MEKLKLGDIDLSTLKHADGDAQQFLQDVEDSRSQVDEQVKKMNVGIKCHAFLSNVDCAADLWDDYFVGTHDGTLSVRIACFSTESCADEHRAGYSAIPVEGTDRCYTVYVGVTSISSLHSMTWNRTFGLRFGPS